MAEPTHVLTEAEFQWYENEISRLRAALSAAEQQRDEARRGGQTWYEIAERRAEQLESASFDAYGAGKEVR